MKEAIVAFFALAGVSLGGVKSGYAEADLLVATEGYTAGQAVQLGIRMKMDEGWHSYWVNPGEGGMEMSVDWTLPEGWTAGPLLYPVPIRFMTGDLPGFGYEGEVILPVSLSPAADVDGPAEIGIELSWLTCNDSACVPGDVELKLKLAPGSGESASGKEIAAALVQVPRPLEGASLKVTTTGKTVVMDITLPETVDGAGSSVYPVTTTVLDLKQDIRLKETKTGWQAVAGLHEYAEGPPARLDLVLAGGKLDKPVLLSWSAEP